MSNNRRHVPEKPAFLPISSVEDVEIFETANDEEYMKLVCKIKFYHLYICYRVFVLAICKILLGRSPTF